MGSTWLTHLNQTDIMERWKIDGWRLKPFLALSTEELDIVCVHPCGINDLLPCLCLTIRPLNVSFSIKPGGGDTPIRSVTLKAAYPSQRTAGGRGGGVPVNVGPETRYTNPRADTETNNHNHRQFRVTHKPNARGMSLDWRKKPERTNADTCRLPQTNPGRTRDEPGRTRDEPGHQMKPQ